MWMWSSSCESCSTQSNSMSSTFATAAMSPGTARSTSTFLPPCSMKRWPTLNGLRPSPTKSCVSRVTVPWCTRKMPSLPTNGSITTLNTCASTCFAGSGSEWNSIALAPSPLVNRGGLPSVGLGRSLSKIVQQFRHAGAGARRHEAHGHEMSLAQRLLERRVQLLGLDLALARGTATSAPRRPRRPGRRARVRRLDRREIRLAGGIEEAVDDSLAAVRGQVDRQAFLAERGLDRGEHARAASTFSASILLTMITRQSLRLAAHVHHARRDHLDAGLRVDDDRRRLDGVERADRLADEIGKARACRSMCTRVPFVSQMQERRAQRVLVLLLERIEIATPSCPRSTLPGAWMAPAFSNSASASVVLPEAPWPTSATVRMFSVA